MGMGFAIIVSEKDAEESLKILKTNTDSEVKIVGRIEKGSGVRFESLNLDF
jgi:phosphoribosylaminoimidazole (AIR) synthetase